MWTHKEKNLQIKCIIDKDEDINENDVMKVKELYTYPLIQDWIAAAALSPCSPPGPSHTPQPHMTSLACWPLEHIV